MAEVQQQSNVQVHCADGNFINILLDANMAAQLKNGQIFITEQNGQIAIQQQDGQICSLEYINQVDESTSQKELDTENEENNFGVKHDSGGIKKHCTKEKKNVQANLFENQ